MAGQQERTNNMKGFYEAILTLQVNEELAEVYKKAIEEENNRYMVKDERTDANGSVISTEVKPVWNGNYVLVNIERSYSSTILQISMLSHTLSNLKQTVEHYQKNGAELFYKNW
ncbi:hypothetical protein [Enterococcus sp. AZ091]|uniref:hypothetical protein n=1 Tax=Enterococcus sp. AZ091 TaxID=2774720 RepID=UPI003F68CBE7